MSRQSAFRGTWQPNARPYVTLTPDVYVAIQGETEVIGCGECKRKININKYITGVSTEASIDSPPGSSTITLSIPDNDINDFYVDGQLLIIPMMEVEVFSKGYFLVGGFPQYYRIFWGIVSSVSKSWSNGSTTVTLSCKDILRWWEVTNTTINPAFIESFGSSAGNFTFFGNQFAGMNPYTIIISLAREAMGDFSLTTGSFQSFLPEKGPENQVIASFAKDVMAYWQLKFNNIWNSLVLYGTSGQAYTFSGESGTFSPVQVSSKIFAEEDRLNQTSQETRDMLTIKHDEVATFKKSIDRAVDFELFQSETQSKLALALSSRDQAGYEFYCDPSGDIVFKPPFYNLNVMPNKPVSWIQNFEIIDDSITDSEAEVITHISSSGNAFGGVNDYGLNDDVTTPRSGAFDFHLLRRYGWRSYNYQCEWAGNPRKLFFHLIDYMDRLNAKRQNGSVTIPMRPELKLGFPVWIPQYESFFYVSGISHQFSVGGQATTTLTLTAKRSKFIAPSNIGELKKSGSATKTINYQGGSYKTADISKTTWDVSFPDRVAASSGVSNDTSNGKPVIIRDPKTGRTLGFPNAVMVFRSSFKGELLAKTIEELGRSPTAAVSKNAGPGSSAYGGDFKNQEVIRNAFHMAQSRNKDALIQRLRAHRYEAGMTNAGAYDYAFDVSRTIKEFQLVPMNSVTWGEDSASNDIPNAPGIQRVVTVMGATEEERQKNLAQATKDEITNQEKKVAEARTAFNKSIDEFRKAQAELDKLKKKMAPKKNPTVTRRDGMPVPPDLAPPVPPEVEQQSAKVETLRQEAAQKQAILIAEENVLNDAKSNQGSTLRFSSLNMMVRPVSDEFGFEVIGHNRYGRGAFIDRGQIKVAQEDLPSRIANRVNIQFAPTGGLITDRAVSTNLDPGSVAFASTFEDMQPDDYVTGASFKGVATDKGKVTEIVQTSQSTYTNLINANTGKSVYIEADQLRKSRTLAELSPTVSTGLDGMTNPCSCGLGSSRWLSYLPQEFIQSVLNTGLRVRADVEVTNEIPDPQLAAQRSAIEADLQKEMQQLDASTQKRKADLDAKKGSITPEDYATQLRAIDNAHTKAKSTMESANNSRLQAVPQYSSSLSARKESDELVSLGTTSAPNFFQLLSQYLGENFQKVYDSQNVIREKKYTLSDRNITATNEMFDAAEADNIQSPPGGSLFDRASQGDTRALAALQNEANFNFGLTEKASSSFQDAFDTGKEKIAHTAADFEAPSPLPGVTNITNVPKVQVPASPLPAFPLQTIGSTVLNPTEPSLPLVPVVGPAPNPASLAKLATSPPTAPPLFTVKKA